MRGARWAGRGGGGCVSGCAGAGVADAWFGEGLGTRAGQEAPAGDADESLLHVGDGEAVEVVDGAIVKSWSCVECWGKLGCGWRRGEVGDDLNSRARGKTS